MSIISIRGARTHNLKSIDLDLPRDKFIVITGLSGSGKSSLAFDTLYAEGQRRYVESLSAYARQFLAIMEKPDVDLIEGLSPAIAIEQKSTSHNPRSTVGTVTEIYDYLRLLYARVGSPQCPEHKVTLEAQTVGQMTDSVLALPLYTRVTLLAPVIISRKGEYTKLFEDLRAQGFVRARIDGKITELEEAPILNLRHTHTVEIVVDRIKVDPKMKQRLVESFETVLRLTDGIARILIQHEGKSEEKVFSAKFACPICGYSVTALEPRLFSFNNPIGACSDCDGLGVKQSFTPDKILIDKTLSLSNGAICGWDRRNPYYFSLLTSLANHYHFDIDTPFSALPAKIKRIIFYGSGTDEIVFHYTLSGLHKIRKVHSFEGVIHNLEHRYRDTESEAVREELAKYLSVTNCDECGGTRLKKVANYIFVGGKSISEIAALPITQAVDFFSSLKLPGQKGEIALKILKEINDRLHFLLNVGLEYLSLNRRAETLSGGEAQRIRLASQLGSGLVGVMYILDEPTIGLHQRDNNRLLKTLTNLRDLGNTVIVVEHDEETILTADHIIDIGEGAGIHGGKVIFQGPPKALLQNSSSITGRYLTGKLKIAVPKARAIYDPARVIRISGARQNNLENLNVDIPIGLFTCITGVSGSGKSSLINDVLYPVAAHTLNQATYSLPNTYKKITGFEHLDKVIDIDQSPIGRTPRSNPATYIGLFTEIRDLFAKTPEARARGYKSGRFSFNVSGGRCEACFGDGLIRVEMHFLPDVYVMCDVCRGQRYNRETLEVEYKGKNIAEVLEMTVEVAANFFAAIPAISHKLQTLIEVGLAYIHLGQSATTLSGGEAQRVKLAKELSRRNTGSTLYILDEPTTGLHFHDVKQLLGILQKLRDHGNTVVVIEHNLDVIKTADWIIDLGPEGGDKGGEIVAVGTPEQVIKSKDSYTGKFLRSKL
ncbi:MAG: excinuclease ABC subunit UvrA [Coxiellaceae bacterium]|jgi:excinuclease ABC subunit A|nr:excinuclease ABC subunit UvrA [Coxiellaceae bacterium]